MDLVSLIVLLFIAGICGGIGQSLAGYSLGGCLVSVVVGFVGALLGGWIARELGWPILLELDSVQLGGRPFPVVWAIVGSALFALGIGLLRRMTARR